MFRWVCFSETTDSTHSTDYSPPVPSSEGKKNRTSAVQIRNLFRDHIYGTSFVDIAEHYFFKDTIVPLISSTWVTSILYIYIAGSDISPKVHLVVQSENK